MNAKIFDPYQYEDNPFDDIRLRKILMHIPDRNYNRTLDLGCGNAYITQSLPGIHIVGIDPDFESIEAAKSRGLKDNKFNFFVSSIYDVSAETVGTFDLIVITGVLYNHFVGKGFSIITEIIDELLEYEGILSVCNITRHSTTSFDYMPIVTDIYTYRKYYHRLDIYKKLKIR